MNYPLQNAFQKTPKFEKGSIFLRASQHSSPSSQPTLHLAPQSISRLSTLKKLLELRKVKL